MKTKVGLFIGRFQPGLHFGQIDGLKQAMEKGVHHFLVGIGSSNKEFTRENPFTYDERKTMIEMSFKNIPGISYQIFSLPDMDSDKAWKQYIYDTFPKFDYVVTGNPRVRQIFSSTDKIIRIKIRIPIKGTFLIDQLALGRIDELKKALSAPVISYMIKIKAEQRMMKLFHQDRRTPYLCVDAIFKDKQGNLILIERKNYPYGIALPGGFVNYGEDPKDAVVREIKEETGAKIKIKKLVGVYGDPKRDPRAHNVTIVYEGEYVSGVIKAGDDAKKVIKIKNFEETLHATSVLKKINFCFDHKKILEDYLANV